MREWWNRKTIEEKREVIAGRDPERVRAVDRERGRSQPGRNRGRIRKRPTPEQRAELCARWRAKHREKYLAQRKVRYAISVGKLVRLACEVCGEPKTHAHHPDYSKPLEVRWLCAAHHMMEHRRYP